MAKRKFRLKVLENDMQEWLDRAMRFKEDFDTCMRDMHGNNVEIGDAIYNRVGLYLLVEDGRTTAWREYQRPDGSFFSVSRIEDISRVKYVISLDRLDLPSKKVLDLLRQVKATGFRLGSDMEERMRLSRDREYIRSTYRNAVLTRIRIIGK